MEKKRAPLYTDAGWTTDLLARITEEVKLIADEELKLSYYPMEIRLITSEQMLDAYSMNGMPINYWHLSFGRQFLKQQRAYQEGRMGLAYEIVINTNPCLAFCMEGNSATMQALVIAHAGFGHNYFFKENYLFKQWTNAHSIIDYLEFSRDFVAECEERYGVTEVQDFLTACHTWKYYGIDRSPRRQELSAEQERNLMKERANALQRNLNTIWRIIPDHRKPEGESEPTFPSSPEENILYFIEKNAPSLPDWKRELIRIVRKQAQYFYPQMLTKMMNEGCACFVHYYIMSRLHEKGLITEGAFQEFLKDHTNVIKQPDFDETVTVIAGRDQDGKPILKRIPIYQGINPYALGFAIFQDIKRICENPTEEDLRWFPDLKGKNWLDAFKWACENFKDESFVRQYLSPKVIRDLKLFVVHDDEDDEEIEISAIHDDEGYAKVRKSLANTYDTNVHLPTIEVVNVDRRGDRTLVLNHTMWNKKRIYGPELEKALVLLHRIWEYPILLHSVDEDGKIVETWRAEENDIKFHSHD